MKPPLLIIIFGKEIIYLMGLPVEISNNYILTREDASKRIKEISKFDQENVVLVTVSCDWRIIKEHFISVGGFHSADVSLQVIFNRIAEDKARFFFIGHNHSNGNGNPSIEDVVLCIRLLAFSSMMEVGFLDSIIFPYKKEPLYMRSMYPKVFDRDYGSEFNNMIKKFIPRKVKT